MEKSPKPSLTVHPYEYTYHQQIEINTTPTEKLTSGVKKPSRIFVKSLKILFDSIQFRLSRINLGMWLIGLLVYFFIMVAMLDSGDELLTEADHESLQRWVMENEDVMRSEYKQRGENAHDVCSEYDVYVSQKEYASLPGSKQQLDYSDWLSLKRINWNYMYYAPEHNMVYCKVPKSGSSTWVYNLLKLAHVPQDKISSDIGLHKILRDYYPQLTSRKMKQVFKKALKLLVVRHPFDRILSAYRDKLEDYQRDLRFRDGYYYTMYGRNIVKVYRDQNDVRLSNRTEPTFIEFVKYIINNPASKFDEHWKPIYMLCSPCVLKYDVISKMNTFSEDTQYVINQLGVQDQLHVEWIHKTSASKTSEVAKRYYSQLTTKQMDRLYAKYHVDFELFGYDYNEYREMVI